MQRNWDDGGMEHARTFVPPAAREGLTPLGFGPSGAVISACGSHRYLLWRDWGGGGPLVLCMLNPSTATHEQDDPTIRKCVGFAKRTGHGGIVVVNLFAFRTAYPAELGRENARDAAHAKGPQNDAVLAAVAADCAAQGKRLVCAWGAVADVSATVAGRARDVLALLRRERAPLGCLGTTKAGSPRHPLMLAYGTPLAPFGGA